MSWFTLILIILTILSGIVYYYYYPIIDRFNIHNSLLLKALHELRTSFWVLVGVLVFRSFLFEPFQIPTGSMIPTVNKGDFVVVGKFNYGLRIPLLNKVLVPTGDIKRGDIAVFFYPEDTSISYIKRVVGLPGDTIFFDGKNLTINDEKIALELVEETEDFTIYNEYLTSEPHLVQYDKKFKINLNASWKVPDGKYFVMGDNRDNSSDSRYFGYVDYDLFQGKALAVWMNWLDWKTLPSFKEIRTLD